jgi:hypothetical protein
MAGSRVCSTSSTRMSPISTAIPAGTRLGSFAHGESAGSSSKRLRIGPRVGPDPWRRVLSCTVAAYDRATPRQHCATSAGTIADSFASDSALSC